MSRRSRRTSLKEEARVGGSRAWLPEEEEEEEEEGDETRFKYEVQIRQRRVGPFFRTCTVKYY